MPYTMEDYRKDYVREHMHKLPFEERFRGLTPDEFFRGLTAGADELFRGLSEEKLQKLAEIIMKQKEQKSSGN